VNVPLKSLMVAPRRFVQFCLVGASGTLVDMLFLFLLADARTLAWNISLAKVCAAETALVSNFVWNNLWTFGDRHEAEENKRTVLRRFLTFNAICGIGIGLSVLLLNLLYRVAGLNLYLSNLIAIGIVTVWNFGMNARFNWGTHQRVQAGRR